MLKGVRGYMERKEEMKYLTEINNLKNQLKDVQDKYDKLKKKFDDTKDYREELLKVKKENAELKVKVYNLKRRKKINIYFLS